jgi:transcription-repair coupling factor (superfamily II helicase)
MTAVSLFSALTGKWETPERLHRVIAENGYAEAVCPGESAPLLAAQLARLGRRKVLLVTPTGRGLDHAAAALRTAFELAGLGGVPVATLPEAGRSPLDDLPVHTRVQIARAEAASRLYGEGSAAVVAPAAALRWGIVNPRRFAETAPELRPGGEVDRSELVRRLLDLGYIRRELVGEPGEFAVRGHVLDIFSPDRGLPARLELFGDRIESLKSFNPAGQRSLESLQSYSAVSVRSIPLEASEAREIRGRVAAEAGLSGEAKELRIGQLDRGDEAPWMWPEAACLRRRSLSALGDALPQDCLVLVADREQCSAALEEQQRSWENEAEQSGIHKEQLQSILGDDDPLKRLRSRSTLELTTLAVACGAIEAGIRETQRPVRGEDPFPEFLKGVDSLRGGEQALVVLSSEGHARRLADQLLDRGNRVLLAPDPSRPPKDLLQALAERPEGALVLTVGSLLRGCRIDGAGLRLYAHDEVFGETARRPGPAARTSRAAAFATPIHEMKSGDFVVHIDHGIGVFDGLRTISRGQEVLDVVRLIYRDGDRLLLPVENIALIQKYSLAAGVKPALDKLGGASWQKVKLRVKRAIRRMAGELLGLYAVRSTIEGISHAPDTEMLREFEASFPYPETPDQSAAMAEIKEDMESERPMDRLLCGDVGFGKTELAVRAAFKAAEGGYQTAVLAPTTVLAQQHFETFKARLRGFPHEVELLSRFRTPAQQVETLARIRAGKVAIVVGTHRLLSKDVFFPRLGLLVIDEEQRFGVAHKEKIKQLRKQVDVLAMTATPIPRTLNMSLLRIRDMSLIETPPRNRLAIQTEVLPLSGDVIRRAVRAELQREGQVFYLQNRIERIDGTARRLSDLLPEARIAVAHAKMPSAALERVMSRFVGGDCDVLVSTSIIENGLDIPRANTMIVERADRFGLAQLYQLRGRVGRSDRPAFAYLLVPPPYAMTDDARKRLQAIRDFSALGSGFRIAAMDLEIRGAGNLLGAEQSGHIEAVGFDLYTRLLEEAARELRGEKVEEKPKAVLNLKLDLHIPESYVPGEGGRMRVYRQIADAESEEELRAVSEELRDLYGQPPPSVGGLLRYAALKLSATSLGIEKIEREEAVLAVKFRPDSQIDPAALAELVAAAGASFTPAGVLFWQLPGREQETVLGEVTKLLHSFSP